MDSEVLKDNSGVEFNPAIHRVKNDGTPWLSKTGNFTSIPKGEDKPLDNEVSEAVQSDIEEIGATLPETKPVKSEAVKPSKGKGLEVPVFLTEEGERLQFRINDDGTLTGGWYNSIHIRNIKTATSKGVGCEVVLVNGTHVAKVKNYGWWEEVKLLDGAGKETGEVKVINHSGATLPDFYTDVPTAIEALKAWLVKAEAVNVKHKGKSYTVTDVDGAGVMGSDVKTVVI